MAPTDPQPKSPPSWQRTRLHVLFGLVFLLLYIAFFYAIVHPKFLRDMTSRTGYIVGSRTLVNRCSVRPTRLNIALYYLFYPAILLHDAAFNEQVVLEGSGPLGTVDGRRCEPGAAVSQATCAPTERRGEGLHEPVRVSREQARPAQPLEDRS